MADFLYVTIERAAQIFRAMNGDQEAQKVTTFLDIEGLVNAPDFGRFLLWNKAHLEIAESGQPELAVARGRR
jgi:hypothetical protein